MHWTEHFKKLRLDTFYDLNLNVSLIMIRFPPKESFANAELKSTINK